MNIFYPGKSALRQYGAASNRGMRRSSARNVSNPHSCGLQPRTIPSLCRKLCWYSYNYSTQWAERQEQKTVPSKPILCCGSFDSEIMFALHRMNCPKILKTLTKNPKIREFYSCRFINFVAFRIVLSKVWKTELMDLQIAVILKFDRRIEKQC